MKPNDSQDKQILFVGQLFPDWLRSRILEQEIPPIQTQRFGLALLDALIAGFNGNIEVLSSAPLLDYPHSRLLFAPSAKWKINNKIKATMVPFINLAIFKHLTRFIATLAFVSQWTLKNKKSNRIIILLAVQSCKIWGILLARVFGACITISYLTDDVGIPLSWESPLLKRMRVVDVNLMKLGLQKISGVIAMTPNLAEKLAPGRPALIMPTIRSSTSDVVSAKPRNSHNSSLTIVYTGRLSHNYGIDLLLDTFHQANRSDWHLLVTGWGEMGEAVRDFALHNQRVEYLGVLDSEELSELYSRADVFVNPKLTSTPISDLAFPSKIVEYLSTGKPVVSTNLPIFDDQFRQNLIIAQSDSPEELIRCFDNIMSWSEHKRESWREHTLRFVNEELAPAIQGARIRRFVDSLEIK